MHEYCVEQGWCGLAAGDGDTDGHLPQGGTREAVGTGERLAAEDDMDSEPASGEPAVTVTVGRPRRRRISRDGNRSPAQYPRMGSAP